MTFGLGRISRGAAIQAVTPMEKRIPRTKRGLAVKYTHFRVEKEVKALQRELDINRQNAFFDGDRSFLQKIKLLLVDVLDLFTAAVRVTIVGLRYISGVIFPRLVFGNAELSQPPGFEMNKLR
jgi:hypothetical protein